MTKSFFKFVIAGAVNTSLSYLLYLLLLEVLSYTLAYSISYCFGIICSYLLNSLYVFNQPLKLSLFLKYPIVYVVQYVLGIFILGLMVEIIGVGPELGMVFVIIISIPVTFMLSKFILNTGQSTHLD